MSPWAQAAGAGAAAAAVWGLLEPLDQRLFRFPYSDIAFLGKLVTQGTSWRAAGWALHLVNGTIAGLLFWAIHLWIGGSVFWLAIAFAMVEHVLTYPLTAWSDRLHPARGAPDLPPLARSPRGFAQATFRHLVFGIVLGVLVAA